MSKEYNTTSPEAKLELTSLNNGYKGKGDGLDIHRTIYVTSYMFASHYSDFSNGPQEFLHNFAAIRKSLEESEESMNVLGISSSAMLDKVRKDLGMVLFDEGNIEDVENFCKGLPNLDNHAYQVVNGTEQKRRA